MDGHTPGTCQTPPPSTDTTSLSLDLAVAVPSTDVWAAACSSRPPLSSTPGVCPALGRISGCCDFIHHGRSGMPRPEAPVRLVQEAEQGLTHGLWRPIFGPHRSGSGTQDTWSFLHGPGALCPSPEACSLGKVTLTVLLRRQVGTETSKDLPDAGGRLRRGEAAARSSGNCPARLSSG